MLLSPQKPERETPRSLSAFGNIPVPGTRAGAIVSIGLAVIAWLALPVMIVIAVVQGVKTDFVGTDWSRMLIYFLFLTSLGAAFTPGFDPTAREIARYFLGAVLAFLIVDRKPR